MPFRAHPVAAIAFALLLLGGSVVAAVVAAISLVGATTVSPAEAALRELGAVSAGARIQAWHGEGSAEQPTGCLLTDTEVIRVQDGAVAARVPTRGASVRLVNRPLQVTVDNGSTSITCPFRAGEGVDMFAELSRTTVQRASREAWRPVDPRVRHLYEGR